MDVQRGHCWRCEKRIDGSPVYCKYCWIAVYCSQVCCVSDVFRHSVPECEEWGHKQCSNLQCGEIRPARKFLECSGCINTWYCGRSCQQEDWSSHVSSCRRHGKGVRYTAQRIRTTIESKHRKPLPQPFYVGNALAIDMLNLKNNEYNKTDTFAGDIHPALTKDYSVLSVGCGNLRNFIHTTTCLPTEFRGKLHTTLNDFDPLVQARNVLFLYMMIAFANKCDIGVIVTTIWYSLHLSNDHYEFLTECLRKLIQMTSKGLSQTTQGIIDISEGDLNLIKKVWVKWLSLESCRRNPNYINLYQQRQKWIRTRNNLTPLLDEYKKELNTEYVESFEEWLRDGIFIATSGARRHYLEYGNPTLTGFVDRKIHVDVNTIFKYPEHLEFVYCVPPDLHPFGTWDHLLVQKFAKRASLIDMYHCYISDQIQQAVLRLTNTNQSVLFVVTECRDLDKSVPQPKYDRIFTSNVADYVGTHKLLVAFKHFLNTENRFATLVTQHWNWYLVTGTANFDNPLKPMDISLPSLDASANNVMRRSALDTGKVIIVPSRYQEYMNNIGNFVTFLKADFLACNPHNRIPTFQDIKNSSGAGLRMRDFRRGLNQVVPFQYRRNVRQVNMLRGQMARMVEWYIS
ncbi:LOW QUALITY PROTEIN: uncharacterized protein [Amphiura filiformis]|uniref:LOW QUALITY PROTEIN: uncharacterized protein n=1 Tax=Amphiura filiformis TaxID=82378 RepID=UPI003B21DFF8